MSEKHRISVICLVLSAVTAWVYLPVRNYEFLVYDDEQYVCMNEMVQSGFTAESLKWAITTGRGGNWNPVLWFSLMLDWELFGHGAGGYHIVNVVLHIANSLLLFGVLRMMTGALWRSAFVAAAFALHPLHVESVAWVSERKDTLSTLFWFLTMAAYVRYVKGGHAGWYAAAIGCFVVGLMSKPMLVTLPFLLLLLDYWPLERFRMVQFRERKCGDSSESDKPAKGATNPGLVYEKIPCIVPAVIVGAVTLMVQRSAGATRYVGELDFVPRVCNAVISYGVYIWKTVWPAGLAVLYPHPGNNVSPLAAAPWAGALAAATAAVVMYGMRKKYLLVGWLWYLGTLVPVIGLIQVGKQAMADRYMYIPQVGLFIIVAWLTGDIVPVFRRRRAALGTVSLAILIMMGICARVQLSYWRDSKALFERAIRVTTNNAIAHGNLATALCDKGDYEGSAVHWMEVLKIDPNDGAARYSLGVTLLQRGRVEEAVTQYVRSMTNVSSWVSLCNNAAWEMATQPGAELYAPEQGVRLAEKVCEVSGNKTAAFLDTLAAAYASVGRFKEAVDTAEKAYKMAAAENERQLAEGIGERLKLYKEGRAYTEAEPGGQKTLTGSRP